MKREPTYMVSRVLFLFYFIVIFISFLYSFYVYNPRHILGRFMWPFLFLNTFKIFIHYLIPITVSGVILVYSLFFKEKDLYGSGGVSLPFSKLVTKPIIFFIILTAVYIVLAEGVYPIVVSRIEEQKYLSRLAQGFKKEWEEALKNNHLEEAKEFMDLYLVIDPDNREVQNERKSLKLKLLTAGSRNIGSIKKENEKKSEQGKKQDENQILPSEEGLSSKDLVKMASDFYSKEDYFSAHYYAVLAYRIDPERKEALRLAGKAWQKISSFSKSGNEKQKSLLYERKKEGYTALISNQPIKAYRIFYQLNSAYPNDEDVKKYFLKSKEAVRKVSFFIDEAKNILALPGYRNIIFVNSNKGDTRELVFISKMVTIGEDYYFKDIEDLKFNRGGVIYHWKAPYGKIIDNAVVTLAIDRQDSRIVKKAVYFKGNREGFEKNILYLKPKPSELSMLTGDYSILESISLANLFRLHNISGDYGVIDSYVDISILMKLLAPFSLLVLSLLGISVGWFFRARYLAGPPIFTYIFIPFLPVFILLIYLLYQYVSEIVLVFVLSVSGFITAIIVLVVGNLVVLFIAMIMVAMQRTVR